MKSLPGGKGKKAVRLPDLGPLVLAKVVDGRIQNGFDGRDFGKAMPISVQTFLKLCQDFGGGEAKAKK